MKWVARAEDPTDVRHLLQRRASLDLVHHPVLLRRRARGRRLLPGRRAGLVRPARGPSRGSDGVRHRRRRRQDRKSTRLNSSHGYISYAVFCLKKKKKERIATYWFSPTSRHTSKIAIAHHTTPVALRPHLQTNHELSTPHVMLRTRLSSHTTWS